MKQHLIISTTYTEELCDVLGNFATGDFPTHTKKLAFGAFGLMGNVFKYTKRMEKLVLFLYMYPTEGNMMSNYHEYVPSAVKETMALPARIQPLNK